MTFQHPITIAVIRVRGDGPHDRRRARDAAIAYANTRGWPEPELVADQHGGELAHDGNVMEGRLGQVFARLTGGGHLLIDRLTDLSSDPRALRTAVASLVGQGVDLHSLELGGPVTPHLAGLNVGLAIAGDLQAELDTVRGESQKQLEEAWRDAAEFQKMFASRLVARWGVPQGGIPALDSVHPMPDNPHKRETAERRERAQAILRATMEERAAAGDEEAKAYLVALDGEEPQAADPTADLERGRLIRAERTRRGMTLDVLAEAAGVSRTALHRAEAKGKAVTGLDRILDALDLTDSLGERVERVRDVATLDEAMGHA